MLRYFIILSLLLTSLVKAEERFAYSEELLKFWCNEARQMPTYCYPYCDLGDELAKEGKKGIMIFSYGSLVDYHSAKRTLTKESLASRTAALAFGVKRLFNRDVPVTPDSHWGQPCSPCARGMLNIEVTNDLFNLVNGVNIFVPLEEIEAVCRRELGYDLVPIVCAKWEESVEEREPNFCIAYTFVAPFPSEYTDDKILPRPGYYELSRDAAKQYGLLFYNMWMNTTYCADGITPITCWEKRVQEGREETLRDGPK